MDERYGEMGCVNQKGQAQTAVCLVSPLPHFQKQIKILIKGVKLIGEVSSGLRFTQFINTYKIQLI